jgi:hypothetical protein
MTEHGDGKSGRRSARELQQFHRAIQRAASARRLIHVKRLPAASAI